MHRLFATIHGHAAGIAQLVEHNLAKVGVASSSLVSRSISLDFMHLLKGLCQSSLKSKEHLPLNGWVAEWLCSGLQSRVRRFDSGLSLQ